MPNAKAVAEADEWLKHNQPIPHEEVLADFGLTMADWESMGQEPLGRNTPPEWLSASSGPNQARADVRAIEQPIALQILKTLARYAESGEGNTKLLRDIEPPLVRLRSQDHRVFFRDKGDYLEISRVLDRKEAYR